MDLDELSTLTRQYQDKLFAQAKAQRAYMTAKADAEALRAELLSSKTFDGKDAKERAIQGEAWLAVHEGYQTMLDVTDRMLVAAEDAAIEVKRDETYLGLLKAWFYSQGVRA